MSNASNNAESCSCPACNGAPEADRCAFVCTVFEAARAAKIKAHFRACYLKEERAALRQVRNAMLSAADDRWDDYTRDFYKRSAVSILESARRIRARRLAVNA